MCPYATRFIEYQSDSRIAENIPNANCFLQNSSAVPAGGGAGWYVGHALACPWSLVILAEAATPVGQPILAAAGFQPAPGML
jgi:hypothetical protein